MRLYLELNMKKFKAYLKQENGCDYTIGCGRRMIDITAKDVEDAEK